jgi:quinone-modifying oxidoreductase subunit QmoC
MSDAYLVKPDRKFTQEIIDSGGKSLKKCFQCATCSVSCSLSPDSRPFPRKEMVWAQWGLKDKLLGDPDIWLCHRCSDCSVTCPRGASPGDVLAAIRDYAVRHYACPGFMGKAMGRTSLLPVMLLIPAVLIFALLAGIGHWNIPPGEVVYEHFLPHLPLQIFFGGFTVLAFIAAMVGASRFWRDMNRQLPPGKKPVGFGAGLMSALKDVFAHGRFRKCDEDKNRYFSHLLTFYGFVGLFIVTIGVVIAAYIFDYYPIPLFHPLKILGVLSTIAMLVGITWIIAARAGKPESTETSTGRDWSFIGILLTVVLTGLATMVLRFADVPSVAYPVYFIHLVVVFALLVYLPYSRFAHMVYRTVALIHARASGREEESVSEAKASA